MNLLQDSAWAVVEVELVDVDLRGRFDGLMDSSGRNGGRYLRLWPHWGRRGHYATIANGPGANISAG